MNILLLSVGYYGVELLELVFAEMITIMICDHNCYEFQLLDVELHF